MSNSRKKRRDAYKASQITWEQVWELPLRKDEHSNVYAWANNGTMALTFATDDLSLIKGIVDRINGKEAEISKKWDRSGTTFYCDGKVAFIVRGWGHLVGGGALALPMDEAVRIQDEFCDFILSKLKGADIVRLPRVQQQAEFVVTCPHCGGILQVVIKHPNPLQTEIHVFGCGNKKKDNDEH